jgi:hypothetical protein
MSPTGEPVNRQFSPKKGLLLTEDDPTAGQIVRGEFYFDFVTGKDSDEMFAHLARDVSEDFPRRPPLLNAKLEHRVRQRGGDGRLDFNRF